MVHEGGSLNTTEIGFTEKSKTAALLVEQVKALTVTNLEEHGIAGIRVAEIRELEKELEAEYKALPVIVEAKRLQGVKGELAAMLDGARRSGKKKMMDFEDDQERKRQEEEWRLQTEAKKKADDEALAAAEAAEGQGEHEAAAAIISEPVAVPVVVIPKQEIKAAGHSRRTITKFRIVNPSLLPRQFLTPNEKAIGGVGRALGLAANVPGVEFYQESI